MRFDAAFFEAPLDRRNTECEKWDDPGVLPPGGIPLWVADMDFPCAPAIVDALRKRAEHPCFGYGVESQSDEEALRAFWRRRHGLEIAEGQTVMLPCVVTGLKICVRALTEPGDGVILLTPVYSPFYGAIRKNGRREVPVSLRMDEAHRYHMDLDGVERALRDGAKLILLCNPHNPGSRLWTREELTDLCRLAEKYDVPVVSDEIHADFVYAPGAFVSVLDIPEGRERAVMLCSASKTFNIAGLLQASAMCFREDMRSRLLEEIESAGIMSGNTFARLAARAAYQSGDEWLDGLMAYLDESRKALAEMVKACAPRAAMSPIEATYLAWLDLRAYGKNCAEMARLFRDKGVALTGGTFFGPEGEGFMRINFACPRKQLTEGIRRMGEALKEEP